MRTLSRSILFVCLCCAGVFTSVSAQGASVPLTLQGLDQRENPDVRSRSMGGTTVAAGRGSASLFGNPANLTTVTGFDVRVSGSWMTQLQGQTQQWVPNRYFTGLSIMMEDLWGNTKQPMLNDTTPVTDPWEQLQKPFDTFGPNWDRKTTASGFQSASASYGMKFDDLSATVGAGVSQTDLDYFFQNNNVTDPMLGAYRPSPIGELQPTDTLRARWYRSTRSRSGTLTGITPAASVTYGSVTLGLSATILSGTSSDLEQRNDRGFLTFLYNRFKVQDTVKFTSARQGTSDYSALSTTAGLRIEQPNYIIAATVRLPYTMTREYTSSFSSTENVTIKSKKFNPALTADSLRTTIVATTTKGKEEVAYPLAFTIGVMFKPFRSWSFAFDLENQQLNLAEVKSAAGTKSKPWVSAPSFRLGAEYVWTDWLTLRGGYREEAQTFSPEGSAIIGLPAARSVSSFGLGTEVEGVTLDAVYEYSALRYQDLWQSNVNRNGTYRHGVTAQLGYRF